MRTRKGKPQSHLQIRQMTIAQFEQQFPDETACRTYLQVNRWQNGVRCPRCGNDKVHQVAFKEHHWQCKACDANGYRFSVLVGTIFENTNKPLRDWFRVMHMMLTSKKGISALQIYRVMASVPTTPRTSCAARFELRSATSNSRSSSVTSKWTKPSWAARRRTNTRDLALAAQADMERPLLSALCAVRGM